MRLSRKKFIRLLADGDFRELFITELGWDRYKGTSELPSITVDDRTFSINAIAQRSGFQILTCEVDELPTQSLVRRIDAKLRRQAEDYICIFYVKDNPSHALWVVPLRQNEKREPVLVPYENVDQAEFLYSKLDGIEFGFDQATNIVDLRAQVLGAFAVNSERITKDFYSGFQKEHKAFANFISGIDDQIPTKDNRNKQWYTSVMLNRLMFCYFIQKKGFLDLDYNYLRTKLRYVQDNEGENKFFKNFYLGFLRGLFHQGLNTPAHDAEFRRVYGIIPYLNGGMFDVHQLERDYEHIDIEDKAFERLFDFFDKWHWHLDTRITASGRDINPDVLGYIFEQYINDRAQMGAYYTKEDITQYIGKNCILPFLVDRVAASKAAKPLAEAFTALRASGDRYIYEAVRHGYTTDWRERIPAGISRGLVTDNNREEYCVKTVNDADPSLPSLSALRSEWNTRTPEPWALPTEIWRETVERFERVDSLLSKIRNGEVASINDFITLNLDIRLFVQDMLAHTDDHSLIREFYHALQAVTILDPTCGSGAFLFAAMNILEPLYEVCIERMQDFNANNKALFKAELAEITDRYRSNIQYFIFKSIILRNLYGVDIMVEATEIAKLRLFLKMVAVVDVDKRSPNLGLDPLPDIDFNIRCGNTLVGYANEQQLDHELNDPQKGIFAAALNRNLKQVTEEEMCLVTKTYDSFRKLQLHQEDNQAEFKKAKDELHERLNVLNKLFNLRLYCFTYPHNPQIPKDTTKISDVFNAKEVQAIFASPEYEAWLTSHQPFHWLAEFYQIIHGNRGFDVIIGNPPYVEYKKKDKVTGKAISDIYQLNEYSTISCGNLYAYVLERSKTILTALGRDGFIIPSSSVCTPRMQILSNLLQKNGTVWTSLWDERPSTLFEGVCTQLSVQIMCPLRSNERYITSMIHWSSEARPIIFNNLHYTHIQKDLRVAEVTPKISSTRENVSLKKLIKNNPDISSLTLCGGDKAPIYYKNAGGRYWRLIKSFPTFYSSQKGKSTSTEKLIKVPCFLVPLFVTCLSSSTFYWYWRMVSNCRHLTNREFDFFPLASSLTKELEEFEKLFYSFENDLILHKKRTTTNSKTNGEITQDFFFVKLSKPIIDEIDGVLARHYGFTQEELDFIINYDIKYRMGDELNADN